MSPRRSGFRPDCSAGPATLGAVAILILAAARHRTVRIRRWELAPPSPLMLAIQIAVSVLDIALAATALYVLLPASGISPGAFVSIYAVAVGLGILSHVPGGIGVFEAVIVGVLSRLAGVDQILGALVLFRAIYYVLPLLVAALVASILETRRLASGALEPLVAAAVRIAPPVLSAMTFVMGAILIFSGVTPATPASLDLLAPYIPLPLLESAHFFTSLLGIGLLIVARGFAFRLDGARWGAMVAVVVAIALSIAGWLGAEPANVRPVLPQLARIDPKSIQCFYGRDEEDSACLKLDPSRVEVIGTSGGHHFDGDYDALARRILDGLKRR